MKKFKKENGAISVIVLTSILLFIIILSGAYMLNASARKAQIKNQIQLKKEYGKGISEENQIFDDIVENYINQDFDYTGDVQSYVVKTAGTYKIECWGASGGASMCNKNFTDNTTGKGGYTSGLIDFDASDVGKVIYIYVGGKGANAAVGINSPGGWNGGGLGTWDNSDDEASGGGGGATDIRLVSGNWDNFDSLKSRIMVAGAGGGKSWTYDAGYAGGLNGFSYYSDVCAAGTQTSGYKFGIGKNGSGIADNDGVAGGGSGYYGGNAENVSRKSSGAGGSSFISGYTGCNAILEASTSTNIQHSGQAVHYSGYKFRGAEMIAGNQSIVAPNGTTETGHSGNGYARITLVSAN